MTTNTLSNASADIATRYVQVWNENDPARRRMLIGQMFTPQATYLDPLMQSTGHDAIDAMVGAAQAQFSGLRFDVSGGPDGHHDVVRFSWSLGTAGAEPVAVGTDIAVMAPDGRVEKITGFLDKMPA